MISLLINLLILCIVVGLLYWILLQIPLPDPFGRIARVVLIVIAVIALIYMLLGIADGGVGVRLLR
jgi:hypothetical protein